MEENKNVEQNAEKNVTKKYKRVPTRVHTRELDRKIARANMKKHGMARVAKHGYVSSMTLSGKKAPLTRTSSYFAEHWREFV